jgi:hypothetical protein
MLDQSSIPEREAERWLRKAGSRHSKYQVLRQVGYENDHFWASQPKNRNEYNVRVIPRVHERASLMPAGAVIPAPINISTDNFKLLQLQTS